MRAVLALCAVLLLFTGCQSSADKAAAEKLRGQHSLELVDSICDFGDEDGGTMTLGDDKHTLVMEGYNSDEVSAVWDCVSNITGASDALTADLNATTALMGRQVEKSAGKKFAWSYHPDNGLDMTITEPVG